MKKTIILISSSLLICVLIAQVDGSLGDPVASGKLAAYQTKMDMTMSGIERAIQNADRNNVNHLNDAITEMNSTFKLLKQTYDSKDEFANTKELRDYKNLESKLFTSALELLQTLKIGNSIVGRQAQVDVLTHLKNAMAFSQKGGDNIQTIFLNDSKMTIGERIELLNGSKDMLAFAFKEINAAHREVKGFEKEIEYHEKTVEMVSLFKLKY